MTMALEEGEIDEEEVEQQQPASEMSSKNKKSPVNGHDSEASNDSFRSNDSSGKKRKLTTTHVNSSKYNSKKNKKQHHHHHKISQSDQADVFDLSQGGDRDDRVIPTVVTSSLMSINTNKSSMSSWSTPLSKTEAQKPSNTAGAAGVKSGPISLFDLVINPSTDLLKTSSSNGSNFLDPIITEKENNKSKQAWVIIFEEKKTRKPTKTYKQFSVS